MASPTQWTWVWASSGSWWWTGTLMCCSPWGCRVEHNWVTELNWTERQDTIFKQPERKDRLPIDLWQLIGNWLACQLWLYKVFLTISYNIQKELPFACIPLIHIGLVLHMIWIRGVIFFCRRSQLLVTIFWKLHHLSISTLDSYLPSFSWNILWNFASWSFCFKYMSLAPRKTASSRFTSNMFLLWFPLIL